jgi:hypothetical protein
VVPQKNLDGPLVKLAASDAKRFRQALGFIEKHIRNGDGGFHDRIATPLEWKGISDYK